MKMICPKCSLSCKLIIANTIDAYTWHQCVKCESKYILCNYCQYSIRLFRRSRYLRKISNHVQNQHSNQKLSFYAAESPEGFATTPKTVSTISTPSSLEFIQSKQPVFGSFLNGAGLDMSDDNSDDLVGDADSVSLSDDIEEINPMLQFDLENIITSNDMESFEQFSCFTPNQNQVYFFEESKTKNGGKRGIVWRALSRMNRVCVLSSIDETVLLFEILDTLLCMPSSNRAPLLRLLSRLTKYSTSKSRIPTTLCDAKAICTEGQYSVFVNIPSVEVKNIAGHACVSLSDYLNHVLGHGLQLSFLQDENGHRNEDGINGTQTATNLVNKLLVTCQYPETTAIGGGFFWSDGFRGAYTKERNNSVWIMTFTFSTFKDDATSKFHTGLLAMGPGSLPHNEVINYYFQELLRKPTRRYFGATKQFHWVCFDAIAYITDRVERDSAMSTLSSAGTYSKRSRHAVLLDSKIMPSCENCFQSLVALCSEYNTSTSNQICRQCMSWDFFNRPIAKKYVKRPLHYPNRTTTNLPIPESRSMHEEYIVPMKLSFQWMKKGVNLALAELSTGTWTKQQAEVYLKTMAVNSDVIHKIWEIAQKRRSGIHHPQQEEVVPKIWDMVDDIDIFVDSPMHLLFQGIVLSTMDAIHDILSYWQQKTSFFNQANAIIKDLMKFRLSYLVLKELPPKKWLAENDLAISRIFPYIYGMLHVDASQRQGGAELLRLVNALFVLISKIMTTKEVPVENIKNHIALFLDCCHRLCKAVYDNTIKDFWISKGNYTSLLNLPDQICKYGSIRYPWEGNRERYIQVVKPVLKALRHTSTYYKRKIQQVHKATTLELMMKQLWCGGCENDDPPRNYLNKIYSTREEVLNRLEHGCPLSGLFVDQP